jgi:agmatinase
MPSERGLLEGPIVPVPLVAPDRAFHRLPVSPDGRVNGEDSDVAIVGVPLDHGAAGARDAPAAIREASYITGEVFHLGLQTQVFRHQRVVDVGDCESVLPLDDNVPRMFARLREVAAATGCLVTLGGDHSVLYPAVAAVASRHGPVSLVQLDAHADTWGGGDDPDSITHATVVHDVIVDGYVGRAFQLGLRGYGPQREQFEWADRHGVDHWTVDDLEGEGLTDALEQIAAVASGPVYISIDIDVLDPAFAPGTGTPEPGGLSSRELLRAVRTLARNLDVVGFDVVEVLPLRDHGAITAAVANRCVMELLAARAHAVTSRR